jgi:hypothetical protein
MAAESRAYATGLALVAVLTASAAPTPVQAQGASIEYAVKAAYLSKFAPFVEWPPTAFASASSPFQLCILGKDPFGSSLDQAVTGQRVAGRPVAVRRLARADGVAGCQILYLGSSRDPAAGEALRAVRGSPVLTVSDAAQDGAIIRFVVKDNRVRFDIDTAAATANSVTISSKLLSLATSVKGRS